MTKKLHENERIKSQSRLLRGTLEPDINNAITGGLTADNMQLTKFHGFYQQDDRDLRIQRQKQKLEPLYSFMLRARVPAGVITPEQWLAIDEIASTLTSYGSIRLTTRQTFQYHGISKFNLKKVIARLDAVMLDSIAACGDVNRNVLCSPNPQESAVHKAIYEDAKNISQALLPQSQAYFELFLGSKKVTDTEKEPLYGPTYLPRKFKIAFAIPPHNDVDVRAHDLGYIAIIQGSKLLGYNVSVGGGMGTSHADRQTFPRLADILGFIAAKDALAVAQAVMTTQRDWGNRAERKNARLKYTIETHGLKAFKAEVEKRAGLSFAPGHDYSFNSNDDRMGWTQTSDGLWHLSCFIDEGRIVDDGHRQLKTALYEIAKIHKGHFRMTANQNIIISNVIKAHKQAIDDLAKSYGLIGKHSRLRQKSMACVAFPTCGLAMAEAERYLPHLLQKLDALLQKHDIKITPQMRMTGCPNGCARPYMAEIGFVGKSLGRYNVYLGGDNKGERLNALYKENLNEAQILTLFDNIFAQYAQKAHEGEIFGDFVIRMQIIHENKNPSTDFHLLGSYST